MENELVVYFDKKRFLFGCIVCVCCLFVLALELKYIHSRVHIFLIRIILEGFLITLGSLFSLVFLWAPFLFFDRRPAMIINQQGIWLQRFGTIAWHQIQEIDTYQHKMSGPSYLGIRVHNMEDLAKQATLAGRMNIFGAKKFGYPPIHLVNLQVDDQTIIRFAQQFKVFRADIS